MGSLIFAYVGIACALWALYKVVTDKPAAPPTTGESSNTTVEDPGLSNQDNLKQ